MFEHHTEPLLPLRIFWQRLRGYLAFGLVLVAGSWVIGILGYHFIEGMAWIDATLNAAMILSGMGPVDPLHSDGGKLFASIYALFSGIVFLVAVGVFAAPIVHRFLHQFHIDMARGDADGEA